MRQLIFAHFLSLFMLLDRPLIDSQEHVKTKASRNARQDAFRKSRRGTRCMHGWNERDSYVAHKPRPDENVIFDISPRPGCSLRRIETSLNTFSSLAALYLCLTPNPNFSVEIIRGFPKTSWPRLRYSVRQSRTVILNRPSIIAMSLQRLFSQVA